MMEEIRRKNTWKHFSIRKIKDSMNCEYRVKSDAQKKKIAFTKFQSITFTFALIERKYTRIFFIRSLAKVDEKKWTNFMIL